MLPGSLRQLRRLQAALRELGAGGRGRRRLEREVTVFLMFIILIHFLVLFDEMEKERITMKIILFLLFFVPFARIGDVENGGTSFLSASWGIVWGSGFFDYLDERAEFGIVCNAYHLPIACDIDVL